MTEYRYFDIYYSILNAILNLFKLERFNLLQEYQDSSKTDEEVNLLRELFAASRVPLVIKEIDEVLSEFSKFSPVYSHIEFFNKTLLCQINQKIT